MVGRKDALEIILADHFVTHIAKGAASTEIPLEDGVVRPQADDDCARNFDEGTKLLFAHGQ